MLNPYQKEYWIKSGFSDEEEIIKKIRDQMGGKLRLTISGGASLNENIGRFFYKIGIMVLDGYGLTETSPVISANQEYDFKFGTVGKVNRDPPSSRRRDDRAAGLRRWLRCGKRASRLKPSWFRAAEFRRPAPDFYARLHRAGFRYFSAKARKAFQSAGAIV